MPNVITHLSQLAPLPKGCPIEAIRGRVVQLFPRKTSTHPQYGPGSYEDGVFQMADGMSPITFKNWDPFDPALVGRDIVLSSYVNSTGKSCGVSMDQDKQGTRKIGVSKTANLEVLDGAYQKPAPQAPAYVPPPVPPAYPPPPPPPAAYPPPAVYQPPVQPPLPTQPAPAPYPGAPDLGRGLTARQQVAEYAALHLLCLDAAVYEASKAKVELPPESIAAIATHLSITMQQRHPNMITWLKLPAPSSAPAPRAPLPPPPPEDVPPGVDPLDPNDSSVPF